MVKRAQGLNGKETLRDGPDLGGQTGDGTCEEEQPEGNLHVFGIKCGSREERLSFLRQQPL